VATLLLTRAEMVCVPNVSEGHGVSAVPLSPHSAYGATFSLRAIVALPFHANCTLEMGEPVVMASTLKLGGLEPEAATRTMVPLNRLASMVAVPPRINRRPMTRPVWVFVCPNRTTRSRTVAIPPNNHFMLLLDWWCFESLPPACHNRIEDPLLHDKCS
jgi:hypothetical protein